MSELASKPINNREAFKLLVRVLGHALPFKGRVMTKTALALVGTFPAILLPWPAKLLIDHVVQGKSPEDSPTQYPFFLQPLVDAIASASITESATYVFWWVSLTLVLIGAWHTRGRDIARDEFAEGHDAATRSEKQANFAYSFMGGLLGWIEFRVTMRLSQVLNHHVRSRLFEKLQRLPMAAMDDRRIGDSIYRVMYDTPSISQVLYRVGITPVVSPIGIALSIWVISLSYGHLPFVVWSLVAMVPLALLVTLPFSGTVRKQAQRARDRGAVTTVAMEEGSANVLAVQSLGAQGRERERFASDSWDSYEEYRRYIKLWLAMIFLAVACGLGLGVWVWFNLTDRVFAGALTVGDLSVLAAYYWQVAFSAGRLGSVWISLQENVAGLQRVFALLDMPGEHQPDHPKPLPAIREGYHFENVGFAYPDGTQALSGVTLEAHRGQMVALVGPAGAGKTTLAYMFARYHQPSEGRVLVDGVDLTDVDRDALRKQVSFVFQEPVLIDATIADNIRLGKPDATLEEMREAAETAGALEFIEHMPQGFETPLGRNGGKLSVGQKQRLSIARALVRQAPVLVLDEPTAALDPETEAQLVRTLQKASRDKLVVVIAHRLSTIRRADQILFVRDGHIDERGSHLELMSRPGGAYRRFVELQSVAAA